MKKVLLFLVFALVAMIGAKAQTILYDWNFSDVMWQPYASDNGGTPAGYFPDGTVVDFLTFHNPTAATNVAVNANAKTVDGVDYSVRFQFSGGGYSGAAEGQAIPLVNMPTQRYLSFDVNGPVTIDIVGISGNSGNIRYLFLTNGTDLIGTYNFNGTDAAKKTVSYTGGAATLYLFGNQACNIYEITVTSGATEPSTEVNLTLQQPLAGGSITADPDQTVFNKGDKVTFTATPEENYTFKNFVVNGTETPATSGNTLELIMDEDKTVTAVFKTETVSNPDAIYDWNFSDWDNNNGYADITTVDGLTFVPNVGTNFGAVNANGKTVDGVAYTKRMQFNGGGYSDAAEGQTTPLVNMPTQRYLSFEVDGPVTIDIVGISGNSSNIRYIFLTDGTDLIGTYNFSGTDASKETVNYTGEAATLYLFCNQACNVYRITVAGKANAIKTPTVAGKTIIDVQHYDLLGKKVDASATGIIIEKSIYQDGTSFSKKVLK